MHKRTTDAAETAVPLPEQRGRSYTPGESEQGRAMTSTEAGRLAGRPAASREPLARADRYIVGLLATLVGSTLIGFVTIGGQLLDMERRIGGLHTEVEGIRTEMHKEIGGLRAEMREEIGELSERMTRIETLLETHLVPASDVRDPAGP